MIKVSFTKLTTYRRCHKQYHYKYVQKLRKRIKNFNLYLGSLFHECLEAHFKGEDWKAVIEKYKKEMQGKFKEEQVLALDGAIPMAEGLMQGYLKKYANESFSVVEVEKEFCVEIHPGVWLEGKIDLLAEEKKRLWIVEHKTCKTFPDEAYRGSDIQTVIYAKVLQQLGMKPYAVLWDYARKKLPTVPTPLKKGGLSKAKNIDTTYDIYLAEIEKNGLDVNDYSDILSILKDRDSDFFKRIPQTLNPVLIDNVTRDVVSTAKQIEHLGMIATDANRGSHCSWCDYRDLCETELLGDDSSYIRKRDFTTKG